MGAKETFRLGNAVLAAQVAVSLHRKNTSVLMAEPTGNGWDVDAAFDTDRCEQVAQIVVCDSCHAHFSGSAIHGALALEDAEKFGGSLFVRPFGEKIRRLRIQRHRAEQSVFGRILWITSHADSSTNEVDIIEGCFCRLADSHAGIGKSFRKVGAILGHSALAITHLHNEFGEFGQARKIQLFALYGKSAIFVRGIVDSRAGVVKFAVKTQP
jgi:hypothetical protein